MALKITNAANERPEMWLYGDIGAFFGGISADEFRKSLDSIPKTKEMDLHIHSEGGIFFEGVAMHSALRQRKAPVRVIVDGLAASAASIVAMGGTTIEMADHAWMMIHEARSGGHGTADELRREADRLDQINQEVVKIYMARWKGSEEELISALKEETWLTAEESIERGLADRVIEQMAVAAHVDIVKFPYRNVPETLMRKPAEKDRFQDRMAEILGEVA